MMRQLKKTKTVFVLVVFMAMGMAPISFAMEGDGAGSINDATVSQIKPIPGTKYEPGYDFNQDAEKYYDFIGTVDEVQKEGIVVDDSYMKFAPKAKVSGARTGRLVGIVLNDDEEVVMCEPYKKSGR